MPTKVTMRQLLETGVHFGHRARKWNPKMDDFIFAERNGVHIIDLQQTLAQLNLIHDKIRDDVSRGGAVLFVGTKRQAQESVEIEARRSAQPFVNQRWLGGTLTNWKTIRQRIEALKRLEREQEEGIFERLTKKERLMKQREIDRLRVRLGGIRDMDKLPSAMFVVDVMREQTAVHEANSLGIPIIALVDTNGDPDQVDYIIPANDDAIRAIKLLTSAISDAVIDGQNMRKSTGEEDDAGDFVDTFTTAYYEEDDDDDEAYLGESTLAKLREGDLSFEGRGGRTTDDEEDDDDAVVADDSDDDDA